MTQLSICHSDGQSDTTRKQRTRTGTGQAPSSMAGTTNSRELALFHAEGSRLGYSKNSKSSDSSDILAHTRTVRIPSRRYGTSTTLHKSREGSGNPHSVPATRNGLVSRTSSQVYKYKRTVHCTPPVWVDCRHRLYHTMSYSTGRLTIRTKRIYQCACMYAYKYLAYDMTELLPGTSISTVVTRKFNITR